MAVGPNRRAVTTAGMPLITCCDPLLMTICCPETYRQELRSMLLGQRELNSVDVSFHDFVAVADGKTGCCPRQRIARLSRNGKW